jgi:hypothetical protein
MPKMMPKMMVSQTELHKHQQELQQTPQLLIQEEQEVQVVQEQKSNLAATKLEVEMEEMQEMEGQKSNHSLSLHLHPNSNLNQLIHKLNLCNLLKIALKASHRVMVVPN